MPRPARLALAVLGLAVAVYGVASLTGGWLGEPPWWTSLMVVDSEALAPSGAQFPLESRDTYRPDAVPRLLTVGAFKPKPRPGREWTSAAVVAAGLALAALAASRRRPRGLE